MELGGDLLPFLVHGAYLGVQHLLVDRDLRVALLHRLKVQQLPELTIGFIIYNNDWHYKPGPSYTNI